MKKIPIDDLKKVIYEKFLNFEELGIALGGKSTANVSDMIRRQSPKFMRQLESLGIEVKKLDQSQFKNSQNNSGAQMINGNFNNEIIDDEEKLKTENNYLKELLKEKDERIKELKKTIEILEKGK